MAYDEEGDTAEEETGAAFAYGMYLRWTNKLEPTAKSPTKDGWNFMDKVRRKLHI